MNARHAVAMAMAAMIAQTAAASERWDDGITARPPIGMAATASAAAVAAPSPTVGFGELAGGAGWLVSDHIGFGATVEARMVASRVGPSFQRAGAEGWIVFVREGFVHALSFGTGGPFGLPRTHFFEVHPAETGQTLGTRYVMLADRGPVDWALEGELAVSETYVAVATTSLSAVTEVAPGIAVSGGAKIGAMPFGLLVVGAHARPSSTAEVGLTVGVPFPLLEAGEPFRFEVDPALSVKIWR